MRWEDFNKEILFGSSVAAAAAVVVVSVVVLSGVIRWGCFPVERHLVGKSVPWS